MPAREPDAKRKILEAAVTEYADRGRDGVRLEHVAERAGVNKALVYRYFGDRDGLFLAAMRDTFASRERLLDDPPETLGDTMRAWADRFRNDKVFLRMILREAIEADAARPVEKKLREGYYARQIEQIRAFQRSGQLPRGAPPEHLFLALLGLLAVPFLLPQITRLTTGSSPHGVAFTSDWARTLAAIAGALGSTERTVSGADPGGP